MTSTRTFLVVLLAVLTATSCTRRPGLPAALTDLEFWQLVESLSEPGGSVGLSENLVSNEPRVAENARWLHSAGGAYVGVGPEQNFTYVARLQPEMAFIVDIRRENLDLHLLYKALFELSNDRVAFISRLFSRPAPSELTARASVDEIFRQFESVTPSEEQLAATRRMVREQLLERRGWPLQPRDLEAIDRALTAFRDGGPSIQYWGSQAIDRDILRPTYRRLMTMPDQVGQQRSFLASEEAYAFVRGMHRRNVIVPVVGDFSGADALRRVGIYVREHHDVVRAFYGSNVAVYLTNQQIAAYCRNLAALPADGGSVFIERDSVISLAAKLQSCPGAATKGRAGRPSN